jgi:hypothetical protein
MKKYKGFKFEILGHSQSGVIVNNLIAIKLIIVYLLIPHTRTHP